MAEKQLESLNLPVEQKQELLEQQKKYTQKTDREILDDIIRDVVIMQEAHRQGITVSDEEAYNFGKEQFNLVKKAAESPNASATDVQNYQVLVEYMKNKNWSEEQYLEEVGESYKDILVQQKFYETYLASYNSITNSINEDSSYQQYIDNLVNQATIVYK